MKELFLSECLRFRPLVLAAAAVHLILQLLAARTIQPLQMDWQVQTLFLGATALAGLAFAVVQFHAHRQPSRWVWLMHRPLPRKRIFGALALASLALLAAAIGLPALLTVLGADRFTGQTVDARHYLIPLHLVLAAYTAWLAGAYLMLCGRRSAFVVLFVPGLLVWHLASGIALFVPALLGMAMMAALAYSAFKPDRTAAPSSTAGRLAAGIPLVLGCYVVLLWGGSLAYQSGQMLLGVHPYGQAEPTGGYSELIRTDPRGNLQRALAAAQDPRAAHWHRQLALIDVGKIGPDRRQHPVRGQIANLGTTKWFDPQSNIAWTFNHDRMLYEGRDQLTDAPRGWFGPDGMNTLRPFDSVPMMPGKFLMTRQTLLQRDPDATAMHRVVAVSAPETLTGALKEIGRQSFALTSHRLVAYRQPAKPRAPLEEAWSVVLPGPFSDLERVDIARLLDGTLLSFNFGRRMNDGQAASRQVVLFVEMAGGAQTISERALTHDFPLLFAHKNWWLSPLSHAVLALPERLLDKGMIQDAPVAASETPARPAPVVAAALIASVLAAAFAAWRLRGHPRRFRLAWTVAALVLGPPCAAALWVLAPRSHPARMTRGAAASAPAPAPLPNNA